MPKVLRMNAISLLPLEVLHHIFHFAIVRVRASSHTEELTYKNSKRCLSILQLVCKRWYDAATSCARLWTQFSFNAPPKSAFHRAVKLSRNAPLELDASRDDISSWGPKSKRLENQTTAVVKFIRSEVSRLGSLSLHSALHTAVEKHHSRRPIRLPDTLPALKDIKLCTCTSGSLSLQLIMRAPNLTTLVLATISNFETWDALAHCVNLSGLRILSLKHQRSFTPSLSQILGFLRNTPNLEEFSISGPFSTDRSDPSCMPGAVALPRMRYLVIGGHDENSFRLRRCLTFPSTAQVTLKTQIQRLTDVSTVLACITHYATTSLAQAALRALRITIDCTYISVYAYPDGEPYVFGRPLLKLWFRCDDPEARGRAADNNLALIRDILARLPLGDVHTLVLASTRRSDPLWVHSCFGMLRPTLPAVTFVRYEGTLSPMNVASVISLVGTAVLPKLERIMFSADNFCSEHARMFQDLREFVRARRDAGRPLVCVHVFSNEFEARAIGLRPLPYMRELMPGLVMQVFHPLLSLKGVVIDRLCDCVDKLGRPY